MNDDVAPDAPDPRPPARAEKGSRRGPRAVEPRQPSIERAVFELEIRTALRAAHEQLALRDREIAALREAAEEHRRALDAEERAHDAELAVLEGRIEYLQQQFHAAREDAARQRQTLEEMSETRIWRLARRGWRIRRRLRSLLRRS
jgi:chromosome segregation ATPase